MLHEVINDKPSGRPYCGPTAIALLTGVPVSQAEAAIRRRRRGGYRDRNGHRIAIRGSYNWEVTKALKRLGCRVTPVKTYTNTLGRFVADMPVHATFLVEVTGHYVCINGGRVADTSTDLKPVPLAEFKATRSRVIKAWRIVAPAVPAAVYAPRPVVAKPLKTLADRRAERRADLETRRAKWTTKAKRAKTALAKITAALKRLDKAETQ